MSQLHPRSFGVIKIIALFVMASSLRAADAAGHPPRIDDIPWWRSSSSCGGAVKGISCTGDAFGWSQFGFTQHATGLAELFAQAAEENKRAQLLAVEINKINSQLRPPEGWHWKAVTKSQRTIAPDNGDAVIIQIVDYGIQMDDPTARIKDGITSVNSIGTGAATAPIWRRSGDYETACVKRRVILPNVNQIEWHCVLDAGVGLEEFCFAASNNTSFDKYLPEAQTFIGGWRFLRESSLPYVKALALMLSHH